jgi:hypothetical protein
MSLARKAPNLLTLRLELRGRSSLNSHGFSGLRFGGKIMAETDRRLRTVQGLLPEPNWYRKLSGSVVACKPKLPTTSSTFVFRKSEVQFVVFFVVPAQANLV